MIRRVELKNPYREQDHFDVRIVVAALFILAAMFLLVVRFVYLQVVQHEFHQTQAESNRISLVPIPPSRGVITDRNGMVLASNDSVYTLEIRTDQVPKLEDTINQLASIVEITPKDRKRFAKILAERRDFESVPIRTRLSDEEVARFAARAYRFPGVSIQARLYRQYPLGESASHLVGFIGRITKADKTRLEEEGVDSEYRGSDHIGKEGLEYFYEDELHGKPGFEEVETDASGRAVRVLRRTPPVAGKDLQLSIDMRIQQYAEELFGERKGALVAIDPQDGGVLALVSRPGFDPNLFVDGIDPQSWSELRDSPDHPMTNRALAGTYPPGSTFKPFMSLIALQRGLRSPQQAIVDPGYFSMPGVSHHWRDDKPGGHGIVDMRKSIIESCDTYYYRLAFDMGIDGIAASMPQLGLGQLTGIDLPGEKVGVLPSKEWKAKHFAKAGPAVQKWYAGDVVSVGIGQGYNNYTPLQMAYATAILAADGKKFRPHVVRSMRHPGSTELEWIAREPLAQLDFKPAHLAVIKQAMEGVVGPGGTGYGISHGLQYRMAGKTGTAQVYSLKGAKYNAHAVHESLRDHSWFIAFAPVDKPKIAMAVIVENGGFGAQAAAPLVRKVMDYYLLGKKPVDEAAKAGGKATAPASPGATAADAEAATQTEEAASDETAVVSDGGHNHVGD